MITDYSSDFEESSLPLDGILGLGFRELSTSHESTLLELLYQQGQIQRNLFTFHLHNASAPYLTIGQDNNAAADNINDNGTTFDAASQNQPSSTHAHNQTVLAHLAADSKMWSIKLHSIAVDNERLSQVCGYHVASDSIDHKPCLALLDSGTSFIGLSHSLYRTVASELTRLRDDCMLTNKSVYCSDEGNHHLPTLGFVINGKQMLVRPDQYKQGHTLQLMPIHIHNHAIEFMILGMYTHGMR